MRFAPQTFCPSHGGKESHMSKRVENKVVLVFGASSGIGQEVVKLFAAEGAKVVFAARREDKGKAIENEANTAGGETLFIKADATRADDLKALVQATLDRYGRIDVLINNPGVLAPMDLANFDVERDYTLMFDTNVKSYFLLTSLVIPHMLAAGKGCIINTASVASEIGAPHHAAYAATKGAVRQFTRTLAVEYAPKGIRVNAILPGLTGSEMAPAGGYFQDAVLPSVPMGRAAHPKEIAPGFLFLASDEASYCTGTLLVIDGGLTSI